MANEFEKKPLVSVNLGDMELSGKKLNLEFEKRSHSKSRLSISLGDEKGKEKSNKMKKVGKSPKIVENKDSEERRFTEKEYKKYKKENLKTCAKNGGKKVSKLIKKIITS